MATMEDAGDDAPAEEDGAVSAFPAMIPTASVTMPIDEKIKKIFNFKEFFHLASRVLDNGDAESVAALLELKRRWIAKFGEDDSIDGGHGGFRPVHNRPSTPFAGPISTRPARRCHRVPTAEKAALGIQDSAHATWDVRAVRAEPPTSVLGDALALAAAAPLSSIEPTRPSGLGESKPPFSHLTVELAAANAMVGSRHEQPASPTAIDSSRHEQPASPTAIETAPRVCMESNPMTPVDVAVSSPLLTSATTASLSEMEDSLKTTAPPPLLETQTMLQFSKVDETVAGQQSEAAVTADARGRVEPSLKSSAVHVTPRLVPAAAGIHSPMTGIFIGNVPLQTPGSDFSCDKFAASFNNSTRKTLSYVNPSIQNGEIVVRPSIDVVREGSRRWDNTAVGYFLGRKPYYHHLNEYVRSVWPAVKTVTATSNGFYFFQFKTEIAMEEVIEGGPWLFQGQPIVLQRWEPGMVLRKHKHTQVPVWIRLRHLPVEFWTDDGLSTVASGVGRPLYQDTITRACTRLDFARVCVMLDISSTLPKHLIIMMPREDGTEVPCKVEVEYEWVPPKCKNCMSLGHSTSTCPDARKIDKPPVSVYVQKRTVQPPVSRPDVTKGADRKPSVAREDGAGVDANGVAHDEVINKGKAVVVYNPFDALLFANDDAGVSDRGPTSSPLPIVT
ncbi:UNVERIFIED_CONTAM: hypothetical protein Sangu_3263600 [Sesamum angustifolium]|uniref:DUF4283 domain-containing protein n=1 Tax=Sesamum angustifolium TaxID=2727405 RepID=A0AAW2JAT7_9LAMI